MGTTLGKFGINLGQFVQQVNDRTKGDTGLRVPVVVRVYNDRSFEVETKSPVAADLLKQAAQIVKGSGNPPREKVGTIRREDLDKIVQRKMADLNARDADHARRIIEGTARSMGLEIVD